MLHHKTIGVLSPWLGAFISSAQGIYGAALRHGYQVVGVKAAPQDISAPLLACNQVDGWIVAIDTTGIEALARTGLPIVTLLAAAPAIQCPSVQVDNRAAVADLVQHLCTHGHQRIAFVGSLAYNDVQLRYEGYKAGLAACGLSDDPQLLISVDDFSEQVGQAVAQRLIALGLPCSAVVAATDSLALGVISGLQAAGYRVPQDVAVVGFDDINQAQHAEPPLTTVRQSFDELGRVATELLVAQIEGRAVPAGPTYVPHQLIQRRSCGCEMVPQRLPVVSLPRVGWQAALARRLVQLALYPALLEPERPPGQVWPGIDNLVQALAAALDGAPPPPEVVQRAAWQQGAQLLKDLATLLALLAQMRQTGLAQIAAAGDADACARVEAWIEAARLEVLQAHYRRGLAQASYYKSQVEVNYAISLSLFGAQPGELDYLGWLDQTSVRWGCLGLWEEPTAQADATLVVAGAYARTGARVPLGTRIVGSNFPPLELLPAAAREHPADMLMLFPIRSATRNWGVLAVCASSDELLLDEDKHMNMCVALLSVALERESLLLSLTSQQELLRVAYQHRLITENSQDLIGMLDQAGRYLFASPSFEHLLGYSPQQLIGHTLFDFVHADDEHALLEQWARLSAGTTLQATFRQRHADGSWCWLEVYGTATVRQGQVVIVIVGRDTSERRRLEAQLRQAQKMESIGRLAGGVAHDFNNLLTAMDGYAELSLSALPEASPLRDDISQIRLAVGRASGLTRQLLAFARKQVIAPSSVSLNLLLDEMELLLRRLLGTPIELVCVPAPELWPVRVDYNQFEQVLINLVVNARDAMPGGGRLTISTANVILEGGAGSGPPDLAAGDYVLLSVSDTGSGLDAEAQTHLFEPFFTTKAASQGTGLGLATCYGIVKQHGGEISVVSQPGQGATFTIYLPAAAEAFEAPSAPALLGDRPRGSETVLLAEDEESVRVLSARVLRLQGYTVLEASNGVEALELAEGYAGALDLLLSDVMMPLLGGPELAARLLATRPRLRVLFISGYIGNAPIGLVVGSDQQALLQKPFTPQELVGKVREVLDG